MERAEDEDVKFNKKNTADMSAAELVKRLDLIGHPEGGSFKECYRSPKTVLAKGGDKERCAVSSVYYLMEKEHRVTWHKHSSDCMLYWHRGDVMKVHELSPAGDHTTYHLGDPFSSAVTKLQHSVTPGNWYAMEMADKSAHVLFSCVVVPGFEYEEWMEGEKEALLKEFPQHKDLITSFSKNK